MRTVRAGATRSGEYLNVRSFDLVSRPPTSPRHRSSGSNGSRLAHACVARGGGSSRPRSRSRLRFVRAEPWFSLGGGACAQRFSASDHDWLELSGSIHAAPPHVTSIHPRAGQAAHAAVDLAKLIDTYYYARPDPSVSAQRVVFGASRHRGSSFDASFNEAHVLSISQAICVCRHARIMEQAQPVVDHVLAAMR
jgi:hypothetical protein